MMNKNLLYTKNILGYITLIGKLLNDFLIVKNNYPKYRLLNYFLWKLLNYIEIVKIKIIYLYT